MALTQPQRRLFIGGPHDGQWLEVSRSVIMVPVPTTPDVTSFLSSTEVVPEMPLPKQVEYVADVVDLFGYRLHVMIAYRELDEWRNSRSEALLKAVLQRDVVQALGIK
jgi:hypothetical protein